MNVSVGENVIRFKDASDIVSAFNVDPIFLKHEHQANAPDYRVNCELGYVTRRGSDRVVLIGDSTGRFRWADASGR